MAVLLGKCEMIQSQSPQALNCVLVGSQGAFSSAAESSGLTPEPRREKAKAPSKEADWVPPAGFRSSGTSFLHVGSTCNSWRMMVRYCEGAFLIFSDFLLQRNSNLDASNLNAIRSQSGLNAPGH